MKKTKLIRLRIVIILLTIFSSLFICPNKIKAIDKTLIFPIPQQIQITSNIFLLDETMSIIVPQNMTKNDIFLARFLVRELSDKYGIAVKIESRTDIPQGRKVVVMGKFDNPLIQLYCKENRLEVTEKNPGAEGYILQVNTNIVIIAGSDDPGAFYGLQSLRQLVDAGTGKEIQGVKVKDWPSFPFRAIRLYVPGPENQAFFRRFMRNFMSLYKYNKVILEFNCMRLDKHPEANAGWIEFSKYMQYSRSNSTEGIKGEEKNSSHFDAGDGYIIEKNEVKSIVDFANENFLEVIPEIPSLTHGYYLLTRHPELAEYPGDIWPDTYCPSNPKSYELMFDIYDEYIDVIKPKMIHIGHDEWWGAPLDVCPLCKGKDFSELFAQDINKIYSYLAGKGIKVAMWGDYLLESVRNAGPQQRTSSTGVKYQTPGAMRPSVVKESIPKDILVLNWFWVDQEKEMELKNFGFKQIFGNFTPNISNWDERIKKIDLVGGTPSSWAATNEFNFGKDLILDFLGCANFVWSSHTINQRDLAAIVSELMPLVRSNLSGIRIPSKDGDAIEPVNISSKFNLSKESKIFNINLSSLKSGEVRSQVRKFNLDNSAHESGNCAIAVGSVGKGENSLPSVIDGISINEDVSSLIFLHASALPSENQKAYFNIPDFFDSADLLGWYEIVYDDGFKAIVPIQYGVNILEWNPGGDDRLDKREGETGSAQNIYCYQADPISCSSNIINNPITFFAFEWVNPRFGKKIKEVNLHGTINYQALQTDYSKPVTELMRSNAILLAGISKVKKREAIKPGK
ncbi:MAG: glycoside hydrolase family 20 zincin-like fold domain-containing protein [Bacteroidales bacterium]|nr:glycoside hydrolase family 20 zincin-like fold domain-containing protein [Bacteroidales bacterium]